ncbi:MAG: tRNA adenosine(34) deaminase TadA [Oxalobacter sp.]
MRDELYMREALLQAELAGATGEVPVGAVIVQNGEVIARGYNRPITTHDPTAHAEIVALRQAAKVCGNYRLPDCEMYVTLEPCIMCIGAVMHARLKRIVFGANDLKTGACGSAVNLVSDTSLNHHAEVVGNVLAEQSVAVLQQFFSARRAEAKARKQQKKMLAENGLNMSSSDAGGSTSK